MSTFSNNLNLTDTVDKSMIHDCLLKVRVKETWPRC